MNYVMSEPVKAGRHAIAVVSRQAVNARRQRGAGIAAFCTKEPVYVVVSDGRTRIALDMTGAKVPVEEVQTICPAVTQALW